MASPLILATKEKEKFQFEYIQENLAQRTPLFCCKRAHACNAHKTPNKKNKTLEDHILMEPYVFSDESRV